MLRCQIKQNSGDHGNASAQNTKAKKANEPGQRGMFSVVV